MSMIDNAYIRMSCAKHMMKESIKERFLQNERGNIFVEIIIVIAIVLVIGGLFWDQITGFVQGLMDSVFGDDGSAKGVQDRINGSK